jgi:hypothetical protein
MTTWAYDSGLQSPILTLIETAVVAKLAPLTVAGGGWLPAVIPIGFVIDGKHDEYGIDLLWSELNGRTPAIAVVAGKCQCDPTGAPESSRWRQQIDLYFVSHHRRGLTEGRITGDVAAAASKAADPGLHAALELAWMFLLDADLGLGSSVQSLRLLEQDQLVADHEKSIWQQTWQVLIGRDVNKLRASVQKLTQLAATLKPVSDEPAPRHIVLTTDV